MTLRFFFAFCGFFLSLLLAPLLPGIINRVKAVMGGRQGRPLLQLYYDLAKLLRKSPVYSHTTSWFFRAAPSAGVAAGLLALLIVPFGPAGAVLGFPGDFVLVGGLFALARFTLILAALDTGSAFEGMGAAREALFSAMAEPIFLFSIAILGYHAREYSLDVMLWGISPDAWQSQWPFFLMLAFALFLLLLTENSRIPVDDPNTHLELTMIHEVMLLDHSGPDLALLEYASALKLWIFSLIIAGVLLPTVFAPLFAADGALTPHGAVGLVLNAVTVLGVVLALTVFVGLVESLMARLRMERVPQVLTLAGSFAGLAALVLWR